MKRLIVAAVAGLALSLLGGVLVIGAMFGIYDDATSDSDAACGQGGLLAVGQGLDDPFATTPAEGTGTAGLTATQTANARTIIGVGKALGVPPRGWVVALATARQEAGLLNLASEANPESLGYPHDSVAPGDHDSVGIFQQRDAWGPMSARMDVEQSARMFFTGGQGGQRGLLDVPGWEVMSIAAAAQAVQVSAFPSAYAQWEDLATSIVREESGDVVAAALDTDPALAAACGATIAGGMVVYPLPAGSGYVDQRNWGNGGSMWAAGHTGTDLSVACGTPVLAAHAGTIEVDTTQSWSGPWLVKVSTGPTSLTTWYAHMQALTVVPGQTVAAGQQIGEVGSMGNSTGCHLHFEVHPRNGSIYEDNIDPSAWLAENVGTYLPGTAPVSVGDGLRAGAWNLKVSRPDATVVSEVRALLVQQRLDVLTVQEAAGYVDDLRGGLPGYTVVYDDATWSARDSAVIVRTGLNIADPTTIRLETVGWPRWHGPGMHPSRSATMVQVEGLWVASIHLPPGGPDQPNHWQRDAYRTSAQTVVDLTGATRDPLLLAGDWNRGARTPGTYYPSWIAANGGLTATGDGIDFAMSRGITVTDMRRLTTFGGSDHDPITFTVR